MRSTLDRGRTARCIGDSARAWVCGWLWAAFVLSISLGVPARAQAPGHGQAQVELTQMHLDMQESGLLLHASLKLELGPAVEEALSKGLAIHFVAEADWMRDRWYWYDLKVQQARRYYRLAYQPLTRLWRLQVDSEPIISGGSGSSIAQTFEHLQAALDVIRRQSGWKVAEPSDVQADARQYLLYRFRLDMSQLPRAFQIAVGQQADWNLSVSRQLRLPPSAKP